jgi:hypothetical protein
MTTAANISGWKFYLGSTASPQVLAAIEEVYSVTNVGRTNQLVEVTNFDSPVGTKEYIAGLAEGDEITVECNYIPKAATAPVQLVAMVAVEAGSTRLCRLEYTISSPIKRFSFSAVCLSYSVVPSPTERNALRFGFKISGAITRT